MWTHLHHPGICTRGPVFEQTQLCIYHCHRFVSNICNIIAFMVQKCASLCASNMENFCHPAPCTPANVSHTYSCETGNASLSWDKTPGTRSFYAHIHSGDHLASCSTNQTRCLLPPLLCGRTYDVEIISVAQHCNSSVSGTTQISSGKLAKIAC